jgi:hypothetical protein
MAGAFAIAWVDAGADSLPVDAPLLGNPLDTAAGYLRARGSAPPARQTIRYAVTLSEEGKAPRRSEVTFALGDDWAAYREGDATTLIDYRLNRRFVLQQDRFTAVNGMADLVFRVMERQNRKYLKTLLSEVTDGQPVLTDCESDAELGLALPGQQSDSKSEIVDRAGAIAVRCDGRELGHFMPGSQPALPELWPALFNVIPMHPALFARMRASGATPESLQLAPTAAGRRSAVEYRLLSIGSLPAPYPLTEQLRNTTAEMLDASLGPGVGRIAEGAIAGTALGGAPTLQGWGDYIATLSKADPAGAGLLMLPSFGMFPALGQVCRTGEHPVCALRARMSAGELEDPAPRALIDMAMAEQRGDSQAAIDAMRIIAASRFRDHPAVSASFALALVTFDDAELAKVREAGLPTDVKSLQARAVIGLPYNVAYWTDVADLRAASYEWREAMLFYDVASSLPMPDAVSNNPVLVSRHALFGRIRRDFPDAFPGN